MLNPSLIRPVQYEMPDLTHDYPSEQKILLIGERIRYDAPSDASIRIEIKSQRGLWSAACEIRSLVGSFHARATAADAVSAALKMESEISKRINDWKRTRFGRSEDASAS